MDVMGDREACATGVTTDEIVAVLEEGLDGGFLAAGFKPKFLSLKRTILLV